MPLVVLCHNADKQCWHDAASCYACSLLCYYNLRAEGINGAVQVTRILKTLEGRGLVKNVKSVQHANRKVYMLAELEPASEITGGAW